MKNIKKIDDDKKINRQLKNKLKRAHKKFDGILQDVAAFDMFTATHFRDRIYVKALKGLRLTIDKEEN